MVLQFLMNEGNRDRAEPLLRFSILFLCYVAAFVVRLFSVVRYEAVIHEYDPYFNYRSTKFLAEEGFYNFWNWFDEASWWVNHILIVACDCSVTYGPLAELVVTVLCYVSHFCRYYVMIGL